MKFMMFTAGVTTLILIIRTDVLLSEGVLVLLAILVRVVSIPIVDNDKGIPCKSHNSLRECPSSLLLKRDGGRLFCGAARVRIRVEY